MIQEKKASAESDSAIQKAKHDHERWHDNSGVHCYLGRYWDDCLEDTCKRLLASGELISKSELRKNIEFEREHCQTVVDSVLHTRSEKSAASEGIYWLNTFEKWLSHDDDAKAVKQE